MVTDSWILGFSDALIEVWGCVAITQITCKFIKNALINSSNWQLFRIKVLYQVPHRKHTKSVGKILVVGKRLNLGVRGPVEKPSWGKTKSSGTGGSHPGEKSWSVSKGEAYIPQSLGTKGNQVGWPRGWSTDQVGPGVHTLEWIFFRTCLQRLSLTVE